MRHKKTNEELIEVARLTGQWKIKAVAALLHVGVSTIEKKIREGDILISADKGKSRGRHIKTEHLRAYLKKTYGNAPILNELQP